MLPDDVHSSCLDRSWHGSIQLQEKNNMFKRIGLISNKGINEAKDTLSTLIDYLVKKDKTVILNACCAELIGDNEFETPPDDEIGDVCELAIAIGGDGTMLMASHLLCGNDVPLLGINLGRIGFLADIPADAIAQELDEILAGNYVEDERFLLQSQTCRNDTVIFDAHAFNDVIVQKWNIARLIELDTYIDGVFVHTHRSDGLIVATPTGSTAYALSGGGPILHPSLNALVLVPICPHTLSNRPIVFDSDSRIEIVVGERNNNHAYLSCDGDNKLELLPGDKICVRKKDRKIRLIHPARHDQFQILREKLHWSK